MISKISKKTLVSVWMASVLLYLTSVWVLDITFNLLVLSGLTNLCLFPLMLRKNRALKIENPVEYVHFRQGNLIMGELEIPIDNIKKIALDSVHGTGYFSLPYNHIASVGAPSFAFPLERMNAFKNHLSANMAGVEIVT